MEEFKAPKYLQVKQKIIHNIDNGSYKEKEAIPSERELITLFDVSRITVRKAIDELVNEGYLYRIHGHICKRRRGAEQSGIHHQLYAGY